MKKMLVIEEPESCETCPLRSYSNLQLMCAPMRESASDVECPLRPLPPRKEYEAPTELEGFKVSQMMVMANADGWNECLEELEK